MTHSNPLQAVSGKPDPVGFAHVAIVGKYQGVGASEALSALARFLDQRGHHVYVEAQTAQNTGLTAYPTVELTGMVGRCDVALVVGGDGTMLGAGRELCKQNIPVIGINQGRLGFITDISLEGYEQTLAPMLDGAYESEYRSMMHAGIWREDRCEFWAEAINDVVINRGSMGGMIELRVAVGGRLVANQRADGLIIATPTGSTAYALSAGGPIVHPSIDGWVLVPIAPHTLSNRPIVLPNVDAIDIEVIAARDASAHFDMQSFTSLLPGDHVRVSRSEYSLQLLHPQGWNYFDTLRKKLHWNEGLPSY